MQRIVLLEQEYTYREKNIKDGIKKIIPAKAFITFCFPLHFFYPNDCVKSFSIEHGNRKLYERTNNKWSRTSFEIIFKSSNLSIKEMPLQIFSSENI